MQLLIHLTPPDHDAWRSRFDADYEDRMQAGMTLMQMWRHVDGPGLSLLFDVNDRGRADDWLSRERATGPALDARFLATA